MLKWQVAIATENPKLRYLLVELLKRLNLSFMLCTPDDCQSCNAKVIITTSSESHRGDTIHSLIVEEGFDPDRLAIRLLAKICDIEVPRYAYVGVDPGMQSGVALVVDGCPLYQGSYNTPRETTNAVMNLRSHIAEIFSDCTIVVRVGAGSHLFSTLILREILHLSGLLEVEVVNEERTTLSGGPGSNESSAIIIAGRKGRPVLESDLYLAPRLGYIKSIRVLVRKLSRNKMTVSTEAARQVIVGERSLNSLLDELTKP